MKIKIGFFSVLLFLSILIAEPCFAICALLAVILHELGHIITARTYKVELNAINVGIYGAGLTPKYNSFSYKNEMILALGGPLANVVSVILTLPVYLKTQSTSLLYFIAASILLGAMNLLPVKTFDGGRVLHSIISLFISPFVADRVLSITSFLIIFILWTFSVYLLLVCGIGLSSFVFSISLFSRFFIDT